MDIMLGISLGINITALLIYLFKEKTIIYKDGYKKGYEEGKEIYKQAYENLIKDIIPTTKILLKTLDK